MSTASKDTSSVVLLDLVSQFLSKLLEKDTNYLKYIKQWNSFREIISTVPLSFSKALSYISDLNLHPSSKTELDECALKKGRSFPAISDFGSLNTFDTPASLNHLDSYKVDINKNWEIPEFAKLNSYNVPRPSPTTSSGMEGNISAPKVFLKNAFSFEDCPSDSTKDVSDKSLNSSNLSPADVPKQVEKKYSLNRLAEKAKSLKNKIATHSDSLEAHSKGKEAHYLEERSPLRRLSVFLGKKNETKEANDLMKVVNDPLSFLLSGQSAPSRPQYGKFIY